MKRTLKSASRIDITTLTREVREIHNDFPSWTLDNAFVQWFLQAFLVADAEMAARSVTGVSHDKGIDGLFIDDAIGKVFILQGKFHQGRIAPNEPRSHVIAFTQLARKLTGPKAELDSYLTKIDPAVGRRVNEARQRIRKRGFELELYYVTTGKCSSALKSEAESEVNQANALVSISILDRKDILALLIDYLGGAAPPVPYLDLKIDSRGVLGSDGAIHRRDVATQVESWILTMSGKELAGLYSRAGDRLFSRNIRGFLGDTSINDGIALTLKDTPEYFWYFNNGVTIVCDSARKTVEGDQVILRVTNPQIINGQQTTRTVHTSPAKQAAVLFRVISVPRGPERDQNQFESLVSNIVAATNWQNYITPSDLRANDTRQVLLQRELAKLKYHYIRKRQTKKEARRLLGNQHWFWIKKDEIAQMVAACEFDPVTVRSGKEGLFKQPYYDEIFDSRPMAQYLSIYWTGRIVKRQGAGYPDRAYAKWHVMHFVWPRIAPLLRARGSADHFRTSCERGRWPAALDKAIDQVYRAILEFYRLNRGSGVHATDISNFFYRPHQHTAFESYWNGVRNKRRKRFMRLIKQLEDEFKGS